MYFKLKKREKERNKELDGGLVILITDEPLANPVQKKLN